MLRVLLISALAVVSLAAPKLDTKLDKLWDLWKSGQNRLYDNKNEELYRRTVWEKNFYTVAMHNVEHDMEMHTYRLGMNSFADMVSGILGVHDILQRVMRKIWLSYDQNFMFD